VAASAKSLAVKIDILAMAVLLALVGAVVLYDRLNPGQMDFVVLLDIAPDTDEYLRQRVASCAEEARRQQKRGLDCRFALVPFGEAYERRWLARVPFTANVADFQRQMTAIEEPQELPKNCAAAVREALRLDFRPRALSQILVVTSSPCEETAEFAALGKAIQDRGVLTTVYARGEEKNAYLPLYAGGGRFMAIGKASEADARHPDRTGKNASASGSGSLFDAQGAGLGDGMRLTGIYSARTRHSIDNVIRLGGSKESEACVAEGCSWLARHQADDGHWSDQGKCDPDHPCPPFPAFNLNAAVAETGMAILAFQAGGNYYFNGRKYSAQVRRGLDWLTTRQKQDGCLFGSHFTWYEHGIACFALAEACAVARAEGREPEPRYLDAARRAVTFTERHQYQGGGWRYALDSTGSGDTSVTGWQVLSLKSALEAKFDVAPETMRRVGQFFENCGDPATGRTGYVSRGGGTELGTAVGLIVQEFILAKPNSPLARNAIRYLAQRAEQGIGTSGDFYTLYNATLAMFLAGGNSWQQWNSQVRDAVVRRQQRDGCARGSWTDGYGRTLGTAWAILTLEVYYRYAARTGTVK
jgi:hypothetical protein